MANTLLKVSGLKVAYGGIKAVKGIDLEVHEGELISLIGSNGAGKTTTMKAITGSLGFEAGDIEYLGQSIAGQGPWDLVKQGPGDGAGADLFKGKQHHSSRHTGGEGWGGKRCVVVGSNNSAHDIAADLWEHGADVTLLQRSPTLVMRAETLAKNRALYSEAALAAGITTDIADLTTASIPYGALPQVMRPVVEQIRREDADFYARLTAAGFKLTFGEDETGIGPMYLRRGSGYYIDVGASELIADGRIKLKSGVEVTRLTADSVVLNDGSELKADLVVYATGYGSMNQWAGELISPEVADRVGRCWGLGSDTAKDPGPWEGELRNMWKPTAQENLWFHGGNLMQSRLYSRFLALQLKARLEGLSTPVYGQAPVHHRA